MVSPYAKYIALAVTVILALLDFFSQPQNQTVTAPVIIGAIILALTLVLHDLEGAQSTAAQAVTNQPTTKA